MIPCCQFIQNDQITLGRALKEWANHMDLVDLGSIKEDFILSQFWLNHLSDQEAGIIGKELVDFYGVLGFDQAWLIDTLRSGQLEAGVIKTLVYFCLAIHERQKNIVHVLLQKWEKAPQANQRFGWQLYLRFVEAGYIRLPGEFFMASPKQRAAIVQQTIRTTLQKDYRVVYSLTQDILALWNLNKKGIHGKGKQKIKFLDTVRV